MIQDISTIIWKEWKELFFARGGGFKGGITGLLIFVTVFGVFLPLQYGPTMVDSPVMMLSWLWVPLLLVMGVVTDSFAGERERHTLETLLASRLPDRAILFGKIGAAVLYGWGFTIACLIIGILTINIAHWSGSILMYAPETALSILVLSLLISGLMGSVGVLVSLRAATVKEAQQKLSIAIFGIAAIPFGAIVLLPNLPEEYLVKLTEILMSIGMTEIVVAAVAILVVMDVIFIGLGIARFRRSKLILD
ncbi:ABC-2 type transporter [Methanocella sp. CWC-04]|uniref:ABC-2 type transporter n=1 Tax=Methanooceanicella nereidis TaxID=2052831 RepID=A0AAP2RB95_9EURY|nr:ABC transporter permease [Methanocella sp. CWC-04]MCD1294376.1 ABC-2 type transporter [Methanocella sp. CWC-04]